MSLTDLISPSVIAELKRIELRSRRSVSADLMGAYRSAFRGFGLVHSDLREYQPGDDIKHVHWKATARSQKVYVKSYEEDRHLRIVLAIDTSRSTMCGAGRSKHVRALEFAALLSLLAHRNGDALGLLLFSDKVEEYYPTRRSRTQFQRILLALLQKRELQPRTDVSAALNHLSQTVRRQSIIFIISDFISPPFETELKLLCLKHDVLACALDDAPETSLASAGLVRFQDAESGRFYEFNTGHRASREQLKKLGEKQRQSLADLCVRSRADFLRIEDNPIVPLARLMRRRAHGHGARAHSRGEAA